MIQITETAAKQFVKIIQDTHGMGVRLALQKTGCNGYSYKLSIVETINEDDHMFQSFDMIDNGYVVTVSTEQLPKLDGMTIDYIKNGFDEKFEFINPAEKGRCGCGSSANF